MRLQIINAQSDKQNNLTVLYAKKARGDHMTIDEYFESTWDFNED